MPDKVDPNNIEMDLFLLIGQSNMQGVAPIGVLDTVALANVYLFNDKNQFEPAKNLPTNGMNRYSTSKKRDITLFGPAYTFGRKIQAYTGHNIGIVSNARGATRVGWWQKGFTGEVGYNSDSDFDLYENAVTQTKAALAANPKAKLKGILWHQGEANNGSSRSDGYLDDLKKLVDDLRADFGLPNLPFIAGEVGTWNDRGANINPEIRAIKSTIPFTDWVTSEGYTSINLAKNDPHFDNQSQRSLGGRYADKIAELTYGITPMGATFYDTNNYKGRSVLLQAGKHTAVDIEKMGLTNNEIRSVKVDDGFEVSLLTQSDQRILTATESSVKSFVPEYIEVKIKMVKPPFQK